MLAKILLFSLLISLPLLAEKEPRAFYELIYGEYADQDQNTSSLGLGLRFTYPVSDNFFLGYKGELGFTDDSTGYYARLALAADIRLSGDLFLTGDYGLAWGYNNVLDENGTSIGYTDQAQSSGNYHTVGLRYMFSDYVEIAVMYRNTLIQPIDTYASTRSYEILYSLNFAITSQSLHFLNWFVFDDYH